jgi:Skp family chaperone for outer membrane proteins
MTQTAVNTEQVAALFEERQRYQSWIAALEAKRATTSPHIYNRVHADYTARLQRVVEQFATHAASLQGLETNLMERVASLDLDEAKQRDEAAEVELRAAVGELTQEYQREVLERSSAALEALEQDRAQVTDELSRLRAILEAGGIASASPVAPQQAAAEQVPRPATPPAGTAIHAEQAGGAATEGHTDDWQLAFEKTPEPTPQPGAVEAQRKGGAELRVERSPEVGPFDDLEFLKSMTDSSTSGENAIIGSAMGGNRSSSAAGSSESPELSGAHTVPNGAGARGGIDPVVVHKVSDAMNPKESMAAEQVKTLKCQECGTLNYPTEWYCERCGAELAAL